jgi:hypothetical protein
VRDEDGLALSSRNVYLSAAERARALRLSQALLAAAERWNGDADAARAALWDVLRDGESVDVDYAEVVDPETLVRLTGTGHAQARALVAARVGATRLIDNLLLALPGERGLHRAREGARATRNGPGNGPPAGERGLHRAREGARATRNGPGSPGLDLEDR